MSKAVILKNDFSQLNALVAGLTGPRHVVKIGILGDKANRNTVLHVKDPKTGKIYTAKGKTEAVQTNAELGMVHELGSFSRGIPARSFLRMPLHQKQEEIIAEASVGAAELFAAGKIVAILKRLGLACENAIQDAFNSRGFGTWAPNRPSTVKRKGSDAPLIDSAQLRKSITSAVERAA